MINYFIRFRCSKNSFLISADNIDIKDDGDVYFSLNGICISCIDIVDIDSIYHYLDNSFDNKVFDFENVPFPEVM